MHLHLYKKLFPRETKEQLAATKDIKIKLETYNRTAITQLGICKVKIEHTNKQKMCKFFVVPEGFVRHALHCHAEHYNYKLQYNRYTGN